MRPAALLGLLAAVLPATSLAEIPARPPVSLRVLSCEAFDTEAMRDIIELELDARLTDPSEADDDLTAVTARCDGESVVVEVDDPVTGKSLRRRLDVASVAEIARSRLLALAIVETVAASWVELDLTPSPSLPSVDATAAPTVRSRVAEAIETRRATVPHARRRGQLALAGMGRLFFSDVFLGGAGVGLGQTLGTTVGWVADFSVVFGSAPVSRGQVGSLLFSGAPQLRAGITRRWVRIEGAVGFRIGVARLTGEPRPGSGLQGLAVTGPWGGPMLGLDARFRPRGRLVLGLACEVGYALLSVSGRVLGLREVALDGFWMTIDLVVGLAL